MTPTTVSESFIKWMQDNGYGTFGTDIFLNQIPNNAPDNAFWVITAGGSVSSQLFTQESIQQFNTQIHYRNVIGEEVEHELFALNQQVNNTIGLTIDGFYVYSIEATMPTDNDRDAENRRQGSINVSIKVYVS